MTKRTRRILFYTCAILFLVVSYVAITYSLGYKYSFREGRFFRTGALTLQVSTSANVYVNDKLEGSTSLLTNSFGFDRLLPGVYSIRAQRDGYTSWQKNVTVYEGLVTDFPNVLLLPTDDESGVKLMTEVREIFTTPVEKTADIVLRQRALYRVVEERQELIAKDVYGYVLSEDGSRLLWWTPREIWVLWLSDTSYQPVKSNGNRELIVKSPTAIKRAQWFRGNDHIVFEAAGYKIVEIDTRSGVNVIKL
ncbi:MAG: carboxypeptidase-like regulatory domain-containing protein [Patescibacteria group bacterium]